MKAHFLKSIGSVVSLYPQNSSTLSKLTIIFTHLQLISSFFIAYEQSISNLQLTNLIVKLFSIFSFEIIAEDLDKFAEIIFFGLTALSIINLFLTFLIKCLYITRHIWYWMPVIVPVITSMAMKIIGSQTIILSNHMKIVYISCIIYFFILWVIRRVLFIETFGQANMSIHREIYIWNILVTFGNFIIFEFTKNVEIISIFTFVLTALIIILNMFRFSYIYPQLEYMNFIMKFICLAFSGSHLYYYYLNNQILYPLILLLIVILLLQRTNLLKSLLVIKYKTLCKKASDEHSSDQNSIILIILIYRNKATSFELGYQNNLQMAYIEILHKIGIKSFKQYSQLNRDYLFTFLENKYLNSKQQDLNIFLANWFLHYKIYIKAVKYMNYLCQQKDSFFVMLNNAILIQKNKKFLKNCRQLNVKQQQPDSHFLCRMDPNAVKQIDPQEMFIREQKLQQFTNIIIATFQIQTNLLNKLLFSELYANEIEDIMKQLSQNKQKIISFIRDNKNQLQHKQFIINQYLFWTVCCQKKFMVFEMLQKIFLPYLKADKNLIIEDFLAVIVSGQNDNIGIIMVANKPMRQFFNISSDKIKIGSENINQILPRSIAQQHNNMLYSFKQRGTSKFIGKPQKFFVVKQGQIYRVDTYVKIYQHIDGLMFAGRLKLVDNNQKFILYDGQGFIQNYSKQFNFNKGQIINIYDMIDNSGDNDTTSQNNQNLQKQNWLRNKRHTSCGNNANKTTIRKQFSDSQLKGNMMLVLKQKKVKANFDYFSGQKYYQGICVVNKLNQIDQQIDEHKKTFLSTRQITRKHNNSFKNKINYEDVEKNYFDMQFRIWRNKGINNKFISLFVFTIIIFFLIGCCSVLSTNIVFQQNVQQLKVLSKVHKNMKSQRAYLLQAASLINIIYSINIGAIKQSDAILYNKTNLSDYFHHQFDKVIDNIDSNYIQVMNDITLLPTNFSTILTQYSFPTNLIYNFTLHQFQGYIELRFKQMAGFDRIQFNSNFNNSRSDVNYFYNYFAVVLNQTIYPIFNQFTRELAEKQKDFALLLVYISIALGVSIMIAVLVIFYLLFKKVRTNLQLLTHIQDKQLKKVLQKIAAGKQVTQQLCKYQVDSFNINDKNRAISFNLKKHQYDLKCQQIKRSRFQQQQQQNSVHKRRKNIKFSIRLTKWSISLLSLLVITAVIIYYFIFSFQIFHSITSNVNFFFGYLNDINNVNIAQSGLLLVNTDRYSVGYPSASYLGIPAIQIGPFYKKLLIQRTFVEDVINNLQWQEAKTMLFENNCKQGQTLCQSILSSSFTMGMNSAIVSFAVDNLMLIISSMKIQQRKAKILSFLISYFDYLNPLLLQSIQKSKQIFYIQLDKSIRNLRQSSQYIILPIIIFCILVILVNVFVINKQLNSMNKQILTVYSVDALTKHMQFAYEINNLK